MIINGASIASLYKVYNKAFENAFNATQLEWMKVATLVPSSSESNIYPFLGDFPGMREWLGERYLKNLKVDAYTLTNKTFESSVKVPREKIEDDAYGVYAPMFAMMGQAAARHPDELVFSKAAAAATDLCFDGKAFLATDHPVVVNGSATTASNYDSSGSENLWFLLDTSHPLKPFLFQERKKPVFTSFNKSDDEHVFMKNEFVFGTDSRGAAGFGFWQMAFGSVDTINSTNVDDYIATMRGLKSDEGKPLNVSPKICLVGPSNEAAARELFENPLGSGGATNRFYKRCEVVVSPYLT